MSLLVYKEEGFSLFHLIGAASGTFQTFPAWYACSDSLHFLQATKSQNILTCKFTVNQLLKRSENSLYKAGQLFWITKQGNFTTKWGNNYKVVQYRRQMKETKEIDFGSLLLHSPPNFPGDRHFTPRNSWEVEIIIKRKNNISYIEYLKKKCPQTKKQNAVLSKNFQNTLWSTNVYWKQVISRWSQRLAFSASMKI